MKFINVYSLFWQKKAFRLIKPTSLLLKKKQNKKKQVLPFSEALHFSISRSSEMTATGQVTQLLRMKAILGLSLSLHFLRPLPHLFQLPLLTSSYQTTSRV